MVINILIGLALLTPILVPLIYYRYLLSKRMATLPDYEEAFTPDDAELNDDDVVRFYFRGRPIVMRISQKAQFDMLNRKQKMLFLKFAKAQYKFRGR